MSTTNPRVNVVLEQPLYIRLCQIAKREGVSLSLKVRDMIRHEVDKYEDAYLGGIAAERAKTFHRNKAISHSEIWAHLKKKP